MLVFSIQRNLWLKATVLCLFVLSLKGMQKYLHMQAAPFELKECSSQTSEERWELDA